MSQTNYDPETGEILPPSSPIPHNRYALRGVTAVLAAFKSGRYVGELDRAMSKIRKTVNAGLAKEEVVTGSMTIKIIFKSDPAHEMVAISASHTVTLPNPPKARTTVYIDDRGDFSVIHPRQLDLGLRAVDTTTEVRSAGTDPAGVRSTTAAPPEVRSAT